MAVLAAFIGVDRHADRRIRELGGAKRDATALWALFSDNLPEIQTDLLVDESATLAAVRQALDMTLGVAGPQDTIILSFSGHGSRDHHLVLYDTVPDRIPATGLPMAEIATRFKDSAAKAILLILDCCFSGGAPARVLEDSPATRDPTSPLEAIAGSGRLLLAASKDDEEALESSQHRHGLLTKALVDALQSAASAVSLTATVDDIMQRVRAEATRLGRTQTPVLLGYVEGGLVLPPFRPGHHYFTAFPEHRGPKITSQMDDLAAFGLPEALRASWRADFPAGLNQLQLDAVNEGGVLSGESLLVIAPTSSGKTFVGELAAARAVTEGRKAVFLFPYKALVNEKFDQFSRRYGETLNLRVIRCTGDYQDQASEFVRGRYDLAVLTYEMFLNLALVVPAVLPPVGLIVVDEAQFITDPRRGIVVELLLTYVLAARARGINPQVLALSAVIGDLNDFDAWLGAKKLVRANRPVPLCEGVFDRTGTFQYLDTSGQPRSSQLLPRGFIVQRRQEPSAQDMLVPLVRQLIGQNGRERIIVFRNQRGSAEGCAAYLAKDLGLPPATAAIAALPTHDPSNATARLRECLAGGTAFHNTNLSREEREIVEKAYRDPSGGIRVLVATTTVAAGINTPASTVILAEQEFIGEDQGRPFTVAEYKNMAGRAGRLGFNEEGRAIILADSASQRASLFRQYVLGKPEELRSSFDHRHMETWVLRLLAQVKRVQRDDLVMLLGSTYGGYLAGKADPEWRPRTQARLADLLVEMLTLGLAEEEDRLIRLTLLGQACGRSSLVFSSVLRLIRMLKSRPVDGQLTPENLMVLVQALPEMDAVFTPLKKRGQAEQRWPRDLAAQYGEQLARTLQQHADDSLSWCARCKRALILHRWIAGATMDSMETEFSVDSFSRISSGHVRQFAEATRFHLRSAYQIASVMLLANSPSEESLEILLRQLEVGIPAEALGLLTLPMVLTRGEYLALKGVGITTTADLWALPANAFTNLLTPTRLAELERHRPQPLKPAIDQPLLASTA